MFPTTLVRGDVAALGAAKEVAKDVVKAAKLYDTGIKHMNNIALKQVSTTHTCIYLTWRSPESQETFARQRAAGKYESAQYAAITEPVKCSNGTAISGKDSFNCKNVRICSSHTIIYESHIPPD